MDTSTVRGVPIGEAASRLGLTTAAVRKRIRRGSLKASKQDDGTWLIELPDEAGPPNDQDVGGAASSPRDDLAHAELVEQLRSENVRLWEELRSRGEELRRKDIIIASFAERLPELPATTSSSAEAPQAMKTSWWQRLWGS